MADKQEIASAAVPIFRARDELAQRLAKVDGMLDNMRRNYAVADRSCPVRIEAFRRECGA